MRDHQFIIQTSGTMTTTTTKYINCVASVETRFKLEFQVHCGCMNETRKLVPTPRQFYFHLQIMAQSRNNVKVLPGWSAMGTRRQ